MVDILAIGSGAVNAYRQALSTTSNNIANTNTPGYTRRSLSVSESFPVQEGIFSFGTGAQGHRSVALTTSSLSAPCGIRPVISR